MPTYEYRCDKGHQFEVTQKMTDDPVLSCARCDAPVQRVFHPVAVHFKGKGFYNTDYGTRRRNRELERSAKDGSDKTESKSKDCLVVVVLLVFFVGEEERRQEVGLLVEVLRQEGLAGQSRASARRVKRPE